MRLCHEDEDSLKPHRTTLIGFWSGSTGSNNWRSGNVSRRVRINSPGD